MKEKIEHILSVFTFSVSGLIPQMQLFGVWKEADENPLEEHVNSNDKRPWLPVDLTLPGLLRSFVSFTPFTSTLAGVAGSALLTHVHPLVLIKMGRWGRPRGCIWSTWWTWSHQKWLSKTARASIEQSLISKSGQRKMLKLGILQSKWKTTMDTANSLELRLLLRLLGPKIPAWCDNAAPSVQSGIQPVLMVPLHADLSWAGLIFSCSHCCL